MGAILSFFVGTYAREIYLYGNRTFSMIKPEYVHPVKQYAAATYSYDQIDNALAKGWITAQEHADTTALMPPRPAPPAPEPTPEPYPTPETPTIPGTENPVSPPETTPEAPPAQEGEPNAG